jgi:hypothetical protein
MTFTPEQIAFIDKMIADRLLQLKVKTATVKNHHSLPEIRLLIMTHIEAIKKELGADDFDLSVLRFVLKKHTKLRSEDEQYMKSSKCIRFDNQVANAIRSDGWPNGCPIESTGKPRKYRFTESPQHSLFSQQQ